MTIDGAWPTRRLATGIFKPPSTTILTESGETYLLRFVKNATMALKPVKKQVLVVYREADRVLPCRDALLAIGINPLMREAIRSLSLCGSEAWS